MPVWFSTMCWDFINFLVNFLELFEVEQSILIPNSKIKWTTNILHTVNEFTLVIHSTHTKVNLATRHFVIVRSKFCTVNLTKIYFLQRLWENGWHHYRPRNMEKLGKNRKKWFVSINNFAVIEVLVLTVFLICSLKLCVPLLKDATKSPVFHKTGKNDIVNYITLLINKGVHGGIKKESVVITLQELTVSQLCLHKILCFIFLSCRFRL